MLWMVFLSFRSLQEFSSDPFGLSGRLNFDNHALLIKNSPLLQFVANSLFVTLTSVTLILTTSVLAGYAVARIDFRASRFLFALFFLGDAIPIVLLLVSLFILIQRLGLGHSRWSLILPYPAMNIGVSVFIQRGFFREILREMEDVARIDGCSLLEMVWYIMLPLVRPGALVVGIVNFINIRNEYYLAVILLSNQSLLTLPAGLGTVVMGRYSTNWPVMAAGIVLSVLPVFLMFTLAQDRIVRGW